MMIVHAEVVKNINIAMVRCEIRRRVIILGLLILAGITGVAQVQIEHQNSRIDEVIHWYKMVNKGQKTFRGWTIQILSTRDRREMETELSMFRQRFPDLSIRQIYNEPYYTLRVGTFISKMEALGLRSYLQRYYSYAILSQENVRKEEYN